MTSGNALSPPGWSRPRLAPEGDRIAAVRWHNGAANVWTGRSASPLRLATDLRPWRLRDYHWGLDGRGMVLVLDRPGGEQHWLAWLDLRTGNLTRLTPELATDARYVGQIRGEKPGVLAAVRHSFATSYELKAIAPTGAVLAEWQGPGKPVVRWLATQSQAIAVCAAGNQLTWWYSRLADRSWSQIAELSTADGRASCPIAFSTAGPVLFATSSAGRDTIALTRLAEPAWLPEIVDAHQQYDITGLLMSPDGSRPEVVTTTDPVTPQTALTPEAEADLVRVRHVADRAPAKIIDRNESYCLAEISYQVGGPAYTMVSRTTQAVSKPLARYTGLEKVRIQPRRPFTFTARDGRLITGFLTRPSGPPPWAAVLVVHGGPGARDGAGMDAWAQILASAGLCCVQVNFRGSRGFGKELRDAGNKQWALAMQDDLVDALRSAQVAAVVDPQRIAATGRGYGGYAALMLATQRDIPLACVVAASAPTDLERYVRGLMSFGGAAGQQYAARIGDPIDDRQQLADTSPLCRVADIAAPVRLFHGRQDARVPLSHATTLADALRCLGKACELTVYENEGHRFYRPQNVTDFRSRALDFLLGTLTGPAQ